MNERKMALLSQIIKQYIKSATPVGSKLLAGKSSFGLSSATIRNEMAELEKESYITHPHTSAGRIPTVKGYRFYLESIKKGKLSSVEQNHLKKILKKYQSERNEVLIKELAKKIVDLSNNTVLIGFSENNVYYTGIANLFCQPEFRDPERVYNMSLIIDHLDKAMSDIFNQIKELEIRIGEENPFDQHCSAILTPWGKKKRGVFGILGPMRMDYEKNLGLANFVNQNV